MNNTNLQHSSHISGRFRDIPLEARSFIGLISEWDVNNACWLIDGQYQAKLAASQLIQPEIGAEVLYVVGEKYNYITQVLNQPQQESIELQCTVPLNINAPEIQVTSYRDLSLVALNKVSLTGKQLVQAATDSFVQYAHNLVQQVQNLNLTAKGLFRSHARQQVLTASEDVRVDGKRINMG